MTKDEYLVLADSLGLDLYVARSVLREAYQERLHVVRQELRCKLVAGGVSSLEDIATLSDELRREALAELTSEQKRALGLG